MSLHIDDTRRLLEELTVDRINEIIRATGGHIARVTELVGYGREADLPFSRRLTELAYLTGILICDEKDSRTLLISVYSKLDDVMLSDSDYAVMVEHRALLKMMQELRDRGTSDRELVDRVAHPRFQQSVEILHCLTQAMHDRRAHVDQLLKHQKSQRGPASRGRVIPFGRRSVAPGRSMHA
jgi:hypothetical protein